MASPYTAQVRAANVFLVAADEFGDLERCDQTIRQPAGSDRYSQESKMPIGFSECDLRPIAQYAIRRLQYDVPGGPRLRLCGDFQHLRQSDGSGGLTMRESGLNGLSRRTFTLTRQEHTDDDDSRIRNLSNVATDSGTICGPARGRRRTDAVRVLGPRRQRMSVCRFGLVHPRLSRNDGVLWLHRRGNRATAEEWNPEPLASVLAPVGIGGIGIGGGVGFGSGPGGRIL